MIKFFSLVLLVLSANACAVTPGSQQTLSLPDYATGAVQCSADAPDLGFDGCDRPVDISPANPVATVCHCIGGQYACFGHQGQPTCAESERENATAQLRN